MSATKTTIVAILVVVLTFSAGVVVGVFASHVMILRGGHGAEMFPTRALVNRLDRRLDLSDAQRAKVEEIIRRRHKRITELSTSMNPGIRAEIKAANDEITRLLTPEQRRKFERLKFHLSGRRR